MSINIRSPASGFRRAVRAFKRGSPVLIHDDADRENETDMVYPARSVTPDAIARLRNDAGGLICVAVNDDFADRFDLPFAHETIDHPAVIDTDLEYDARPSFSLTVNHRDTYTGITDEDRALTIRSLGEAAAEPDGVDFTSEFRTPGHVHLLRGAPNLIEDRTGHTELALELARIAEREPAVVVCEMLDDTTHTALSKTAALDYADRHGIAFLDSAMLRNGPRGEAPGEQGNWVNHLR